MILFTIWYIGFVLLNCIYIGVMFGGGFRPSEWSVLRTVTTSVLLSASWPIAALLGIVLVPFVVIGLMAEKYERV